MRLSCSTPEVDEGVDLGTDKGEGSVKMWDLYKIIIFSMKRPSQIYNCTEYFGFLITSLLLPSLFNSCGKTCSVTGTIIMRGREYSVKNNDLHDFKDLL